MQVHVYSIAVVKNMSLCLSSENRGVICVCISVSKKVHIP